MANEKTIRSICPGCGGDGIAVRNIDGPGPPQMEEYSCTKCSGTGYILSGKLEDHDHYFLSRDVFACLNYFEWVDLDAQPKELLHVILSMGTLNLSEGSAELATLRVIFPVGKLTRTALEALIA